MEELSINDFVTHKNELYVLETINRALGYGLYTIRNLMTNVTITVTRLQLEKVDLDMAEEIEGVTPIDNDMINDNISNNRFRLPDDEEIAKLKQERNRPSTEKQTRWAVKIFKGRKDHDFLENHVQCYQPS